jgi:hypothetical protein
VGLGEGTSEDCEVLCEDEDATPGHKAVSGHDAVTGVKLFVEVEVSGAVNDKLVELLERAFIQKKLDALSRRPLTGPVLALHALFAPARRGERLSLAQTFKFRVMCIFDWLSFHRIDVCRAL